MKKRLMRQEGFRLFLLTLPFLALILVLAYLPLYGWIYAFFDYRPGIALNWDQYVGIKFFAMTWETSFKVKEIGRVLTNTFGIKLIGYLFSPIPVIFAMFLSEVRGKHFRKTIQTVTTLPNFISWILVYSIAYSMFSTEDGFINKFLMSIGAIDRELNFLGSSNFVWLKINLWGLWKGLGWNAIIYFAAIAGIDQQLIEAAEIDGAGRYRIMWNITLPELIPTYFVLLVLSIADFLNTGFEQYMVFSNAFKASRLEVLDFYIYNQGFTDTRYAYATAVGMLKSFVGIALLFSANRFSKLVRGEGVM